MSQRRRAIVAGLAMAAATSVAAAAPAGAAVDPGPTQVASRSTTGAPAEAASWAPRVSADGRHVAFTSEATTLVPSDTNGVRDVFVKDLATGALERVSVGGAGRQLTGHSYVSSISADGTRVLFTTYQPLGGADPVLEPGTYLRDRSAGTTTRLRATSPDGATVPVGGAELSGNGRFAVVSTQAALVARDDNDATDVYRLELATGAARLVSTGIRTDDFRQTRWPAISHSGRFVAFDFTARLVRRDRLRAWDVYVRDLRQRRPELVTRSSAGEQANRGSMAPAISAGGRYVGYTSYASNLVRGDSNDDWDVFLHDRRRDTTERVSVSSGGRQGNAQSQGPGFWGEAASISRDGRFVVFGSLAGNLAPETNDAFGDVYVRDRSDGTTTALSLTPAGTGGSGDSGGVRISGDGSTVTFWSEAPDLVVDDVNTAVTDVFVRRLGG